MTELNYLTVGSGEAFPERRKPDSCPPCGPRHPLGTWPPIGVTVPFGAVNLGYDIRRDAAAIKRRVGYMTQRFSLYEDLSIRENLDFVARLYAMDRRRERVAAALDRLGLTGRRDQLAGTLSGGWKQRLALAAAVLHEPDLLLLDEPTAGVDPKARREFWDELHTLAREGITVLVATHYMDEAERCDEIVFIAYGELLAKGRQDEVLAAAGIEPGGGNLEEAFVRLIGQAHDNYAATP